MKHDFICLHTINVSDRIFVVNFNDSLNMDLVKA